MLIKTRCNERPTAGTRMWVRYGGPCARAEEAPRSLSPASYTNQYHVQIVMRQLNLHKLSTLGQEANKRGRG